MDIQPETTLVELIRYNNWANAQVLAACQKLTTDQLAAAAPGAAAPGAYGTIRDTLEHSIRAEIDIDAARRFILGKQGLWPGWRWRGIQGSKQAMRAMEYLQLDPLQIIARIQDIVLNSRVLDYRPSRWEDVTYQQRKYFDWGGWLAIQPMEELPYWRVVMRRELEGGPKATREVDLTRRPF